MLTTRTVQYFAPDESPRPFGWSFPMRNQALDSRLQTRVVLVSQTDLILTEYDDGLSAEDVHAAIQAAALAHEWTAAQQLASKYALDVCLRCTADFSAGGRARIHLPELGIPAWGDLCQRCARITAGEIA